MTRSPVSPPAAETSVLLPLTGVARRRAARGWRAAVLLGAERLCREFPGVPPGTVLSTSLTCYRELCRIAGPEQWARSPADLAALVEDTARMRLRHRARPR